jgi:hypothetical protein
MAINHAVADVLDQTIQALTLMDLNKLQSLERRISLLAESNATCDREGLPSLLAKKRLLELILQSCKSNLDALNRLHRRNTRDQWAH